MAKYAADVNKQSKIIDVQKQFPGGLKTVDTDDALGKVYLRKADNVSLSEYSFLEKRHGTAIEHVFTFEPGDEPNLLQPIQGYFEYKKDDGSIDKLLFIGGTAYVKESDSSNYVKITVFDTEEGYIYPDSEIYSEVTGSLLIDNVENISDTVIATLEATVSRPSQEDFVFTDTVNASLTAVIEEFIPEFTQPSTTSNINFNTTLSYSRQ